VALTPILPRLMKLGRLGRKSGLGIYRYTDNDSRTRGSSDAEFSQLIAPYIKTQNAKTYKPEQIVERIVAVMVDEGVKILEEEMVGDLRDIELCVIQGLSFPQHRGGIFFWADTAGLSKTWLGEGTRFYDSLKVTG
jgi:3-hydroxyacyl-CoA dehydrogenase